MSSESFASAALSESPNVFVVGRREGVPVRVSRLDRRAFGHARDDFSRPYPGPLEVLNQVCDPASNGYNHEVEDWYASDHLWAYTIASSSNRQLMDMMPGRTDRVLR